MKCTYTGNFDTLHDLNKKRRIIGPVKEKILKSIINDKMGCETYREIEATRLMKMGK